MFEDYRTNLVDAIIILKKNNSNRMSNENSHNLIVNKHEWMINRNKENSPSGSFVTDRGLH